MPEISDELRNEIMNELFSDINRFTQTAMTATNPNSRIPSYAQLEQMVYITEQIRLKLKLLGAPRIN